MQTTHEDKAYRGDIEPSRDPAETANPVTPEEELAVRQVAALERELRAAHRQLVPELSDKKSPYQPGAVLFLRPGEPAFPKIEEIRERVDKAKVVLSKLRRARDQRIRQHRADHDGRDSAPHDVRPTGLIEATRPAWLLPNAQEVKQEQQAWSSVVDAMAKTVAAAREVHRHPFNEGKQHALANALEAEEEARIHHRSLEKRRLERQRRELEDESFAAADLEPISSGKNR